MEENNNELTHHGVKGMKWGHRKKYYDEKGRLTDEGKQRESVRAAKLYYKEKKLNRTADITLSYGRHLDSQGRAKLANRQRTTIEKTITKKHIDAGRAKVAKTKNLQSMALSTAASTAAFALGVAAVSNVIVTLPMVAAIGAGSAIAGATTRTATGGRFYREEAKNYDKKR